MRLAHWRAPCLCQCGRARRYCILPSSWRIQTWKCARFDCIALSFGNKDPNVAFTVGNLVVAPNYWRKTTPFLLTLHC